MLSPRETARIWGQSISGRLDGARSLSGSALATVHEDLCEGCPVAVWPYGNATSINPLMVTLGPSPGGSPDPGVADPAGEPLELPTAGVRHPHTTYQDSRGFWRDIRLLARTVVQSGATGSEDSYALFGNMNLDTNRSGRASGVRIDPAFGEWVLRTIRDKLRLRFVICLGLKSKPQALKLLSRAFDEFDPARPPHAEHELECYRRRRHVFQEWDCEGPHGNRIKLVLWPQHPSRSPFTNPETWRDACMEFADRRRGVIRP